jgi:hypothetical protein
LEDITAIWYILWSLGNLVAIWNIFHRFGILCQEKSGNPGVKDPESLCIEKAYKGELFLSAADFLFGRKNFRDFKRWAKVQADGGNVIIFWKKWRKNIAHV